MRVVALLVCLLACPLGASGAGSWRYFADVSKNGRNPLLLSVLLLFAWCVVLEYGPISRFKGVFSAVWSCCVGLYCLGALRGLWGFCVREWLGGFMACCVFALLFLLFASVFLLFASVCLLSLPIFWGFAFVVLGLSSCLPCLLLCLCGFVCAVVSFSLSDYAQKERAQYLASSRVLLLFSFSLLYFPFKCLPILLIAMSAPISHFFNEPFLCLFFRKKTPTHSVLLSCPISAVCIRRYTIIVITVFNY